MRAGPPHPIYRGASHGLCFTEQASNTPLLFCSHGKPPAVHASGGKTTRTQSQKYHRNSVWRCIYSFRDETPLCVRGTQII